MATPASAERPVSRWARGAADRRPIPALCQRTAPSAGSPGAQHELGAHGADRGGCTRFHDPVADLRFRQGLRRSSAVAPISARLCDHRQSRLRLSNQGRERRLAEPDQLHLRLCLRIQFPLSRMLCEGRRASRSVQSTVPAGRGLLLYGDEPGTGRADDRHDSALGSFGPGGAEAILPATRLTGHGYGGVVQFHIYLDDLFPHSIGKPISEWW